MKLTTTSIFVLFTLLITTAALCQAPSRGCSLRTVAGAYGYQCSGTSNGMPFAANGYIYDDVNGVWRSHGTLSLNGTVMPWTADVRPNDPVKINPDCTGSASFKVTINGQPAPDAHFDFIVMENGRNLRGIETDPGTTVTCMQFPQK